ncbi:hypothetical protein ACROYT_G003060 [Oculina patagonica]
MTRANLFGDDLSKHLKDLSEGKKTGQQMQKASWHALIRVLHILNGKNFRGSSHMIRNIVSLRALHQLLVTILTTWDVKPVLTYLSSLNPVEELELKTLKLKLLMLMSLVSAQRGQSLHILDIAYMKEAPDGFEFLLYEHMKQTKPSYKAPSIILKAFEADSSLCVVTCLKEYLKRTKSLRDLETKLFISFVKPYKRVSRETISRWIRSVMETAGVDTNVFKPHSTRAAVSSKAKAACVPVHDILRTAGWPSSICFDLFYNKSVESSNFASAILHSD